MTLIDGKYVSSKYKEEIRERIKSFDKVPGLAVIRIGEDEASKIYVRLKHQMCEELDLHIDYAVLLDVSYDVALKRTLGRQICPKCKQTYNKLTGVNAPIVDNMCNDCNVELTTRNDDNEETLLSNINFNNLLSESERFLFVLTFFNK